MSDHSVTHATFVIERTYPVPPDQVFAAWADVGAKSQWFRGPDEWDNGPHELDFRVGGQERTSGGPKGGPVHSYQAEYRDIVPGERIVTTYEMAMDDTRTSVSVATLEFEATAAGTQLRYTEQGAYLDGLDTPEAREEGGRALFEALADHLLRQSSQI